jgi:uncharacterized protein involved in exopolysaccharide biosynthesis
VWPSRAFLELSALLGTVGIVVALVAYTLTPRQYTSTSAVVAAQDARQPAGGALGALGALGLSAGGSMTSPQFLASLLSSRDVLTAVLNRRFVAPGSHDSLPLVDILTKHTHPTLDEFARARDALNGSIATDADPRTSVVGLAVTLRDPALARAVNAALITQADSSNQAMHRQQAAGRRMFVEQRLAIAQSQLRGAEEQLRSFRQANVVRSSPTLQLQEERLQREIMSRQDVYTSLARDYEQALQDEARNLPSISIFVTPDLPWRKSRPRGLFFVVAGAAAGVLVATLVTLVGMLRAENAPMPRTARELLRQSRTRRYPEAT